MSDHVSDETLPEASRRIVGVMAEQEAPHTVEALRTAAPARADIAKLRAAAEYLGPTDYGRNIALAIGEIEGYRALLGIRP